MTLEEQQKHKEALLLAGKLVDKVGNLINNYNTFVSMLESVKTVEKALNDYNRYIFDWTAEKRKAVEM